MCDGLVPDSVKNAASSALKTMSSAVSFGGANQVAQNAHTQVVTKGEIKK